VVELDQTGSLSRHQLATFLADELPVGARVQLRVRSEPGVSSHDRARPAVA
jgi:hypothetical protein